MTLARRILAPALLAAAVVLAPSTAAQAIPNPEPVVECDGPRMEWVRGQGCQYVPPAKPRYDYEVIRNILLIWWP